MEKMLEREEMTSTFMGNFVAIPHGTDDAKTEVKNSGTCDYPSTRRR